jgi:long-chain fatty acid transport protein
MGEDQPEYTNDTMTTTGSMPFNMDWSDQVVVKIGAEFQATKELKVRAGYNYGKMPLNEDRAFENVAFPAVSEHHFSLGAGYDIGALTVNVTGVYSPEASIEGANAAGQYIAAYESKMSQFAADLGIAYKF